MASKDRIRKVREGYRSVFGHFPFVDLGMDPESDYYLDIIEQQTKNKDKDRPSLYDDLSDGEDR